MSDDFILLGPDGEPDYVLHAEYEAKAIERGSGMTDITPARDEVKPVLRLVGADGNAFNLLGLAARALKKAGRGDEVEAFQTEATSGDYDHLLVTCMKWFEVS